jgi:hypothetical protein
MWLCCVLSLFCDVFQTTFAKVGAWVYVPVLRKNFNDLNAHRCNQGFQFRGVIITPNKKNSSSALMVGSGFTYDNPATAGDNKGVLGRLWHSLAKG